MKVSLSCRLLLLIVSLLASTYSQEVDLTFVTNAGEGRYAFAYNETYIMGGIGPLPPGLFRVNCLLNGQSSTNITYFNTGGDDGTFQVDNSTGALSLQEGRILDYEVTTNYRFGVGCILISDPQTSRSAQVDFTVLPVNEFEPDITLSVTVIANEFDRIGTVLVARDDDSEVRARATFRATDDDAGPNGILRYTLAFNENLTAFDVDENSGRLTVAQSLDVDSTTFGFSNDEIRLTVCDIDPPISTCPNLLVRILIFASNDNNPVFSQDVYPVTVNESVPTGTLLEIVSCTDGDKGNGQFSHVSSSSSLFNVTSTPTEQSIYLDGQLDFETARSQTITLTCFDTDGVTANASLVITIEPVNDNPPRFSTNEYYFSMNRITTTGNEVGRVMASDPDKIVGEEITYTLTGNDNFQIQGDGSIVLSDFVYILEGQTFTLEATVSDGQFSDRATVVIIVNGVFSVPEIVLICISFVIFLVLVVFVIVCCCYCCVCCSRLVPKQRHVDVPVITNENALMSIPMTPIVGPDNMYNQGNGPPLYMIGQIPREGMTPWESQSVEDESVSEIDPDMGSVLTASSRVYTPSPYLKEMVEMFQEGDQILQGKKSKKKE